MTKYTFDTTADQDEAIEEVAAQAGQVAADYVTSQVVDRFLAEVVNKGTQVKKEKVADAWANADAQKKAEVEATLEI